MNHLENVLFKWLFKCNCELFLNYRATKSAARDPIPKIFSDPPQITSKKDNDTPHNHRITSTEVTDTTQSHRIMSTEVTDTP